MFSIAYLGLQGLRR